MILTIVRHHDKLYHRLDSYYSKLDLRQGVFKLQFYDMIRGDTEAMTIIIFCLELGRTPTQTLRCWRNNQKVLKMCQKLSFYIA